MFPPKTQWYCNTPDGNVSTPHRFKEKYQLLADASTKLPYALEEFAFNECTALSVYRLSMQQTLQMNNRSVYDNALRFDKHLTPVLFFDLVFYPSFDHRVRFLYDRNQQGRILPMHAILEDTTLDPFEFANTSQGDR